MCFIPHVLSGPSLGVAVIQSYGRWKRLKRKGDPPREDPKGPYINLVAARLADKDKPWLKLLVQSYQTPEVREFVLSKFKGAVLPSW